jgi:hypothetical protein
MGYSIARADATRTICGFDEPELTTACANSAFRITCMWILVSSMSRQCPPMIEAAMIHLSLWDKFRLVVAEIRPKHSASISDGARVRPT